MDVRSTRDVETLATDYFLLIVYTMNTKEILKQSVVAEKRILRR